MHLAYCLKCGTPMPFQRNKGFQKEKFHRKRMWCPTCRQLINHVEVKNMEEKEEFLINFKNGVYIDEAEKSCNFIGAARCW